MQQVCHLSHGHALDATISPGPAKNLSRFRSSRQRSLEHGHCGDPRRRTVARKVLCVASVLLILAFDRTRRWPSFGNRAPRRTRCGEHHDHQWERERGRPSSCSRPTRSRMYQPQRPLWRNRPTGAAITRNTQRIVILVDVPIGGNTRVAISEFGAPVFPDAESSKTSAIRSTSGEGLTGRARPAW